MVSTLLVVGLAVAPYVLGNDMAERPGFSSTRWGSGDRDHLEGLREPSFREATGDGVGAEPATQHALEDVHVGSLADVPS